MPTLSHDRIAALLAPYLPGPAPDPLLAGLSSYLDLLMLWNARTNLTAVREPERIVERHFGESLFAAHQLGSVRTLLDFGSGAGFPGIPAQLLDPAAAVTLAESQGKKAAFLREAVRTLHLPSRVWGNRVEAMPSAEQFDAVTMRAVDHTDAMLPVGAARVAAGGCLLLFSGTETGDPMELLPAPSFTLRQTVPVPQSHLSLLLFRREE